MTDKMPQKFIKDKLNELGVSLNDISLGDFDYIGEYTAKKAREQNSPLWRSTGAYFRPNYERMILIYSLITRFKLQSYLEIGFGRGASAIAAAKALYDIGSPGKVVTVDPSFDEQQLRLMQQVFPKQWLDKLEFQKGMSQDVLPTLLKNNTTFDLVYIDGDHRYDATKRDWELLKNSWNSALLFDDYHLPTKNERDIECARAIDEIDETQHDATKELIITDRRIFFDDRRIADEDVDYGQVLMLKKHLLTNNDW